MLNFPTLILGLFTSPFSSTSSLHQIICNSVIWYKHLELPCLFNDWFINIMLLCVSGNFLYMKSILLDINIDTTFFFPVTVCVSFPILFASNLTILFHFQYISSRSCFFVLWPSLCFNYIFRSSPYNLPDVSTSACFFLFCFPLCSLSLSLISLF